ncbi:MAG: energy-coupled thiamine transporter ThiT [Oscillospiraceae bacterium]|nr:energy-coupled thiamine transporter ThiT [Oscillospiraceae bacterium]
MSTSNTSGTAVASSHARTLRMVETGLLLAIATVLSVIQPYQLPFGGGITVASMLPVVLISYRHGVKWGLFSGFIYSLLQMAMGFGTVKSFFVPEDYAIWAGIGIVLMDYVIAYTVLGFGGLFRNQLKTAPALCLGTVIALLFRYIVHIISGAVFFGAWAEWFFTQDGFYAIGAKIVENFSGASLAVIYSVFYNGLYMIPEIIVTVIVAYVVSKVPAIAKKIN